VISKLGYEAYDVCVLGATIQKALLTDAMATMMTSVGDVSQCCNSTESTATCEHRQYLTFLSSSVSTIIITIAQQRNRASSAILRG